MTEIRRRTPCWHEQKNRRAEKARFGRKSRNWKNHHPIQAVTKNIWHWWLSKCALWESREIEKQKIFAISGFAKDLLEIGDNLDRALNSAKHLEGKENPLYEGVKITKSSFATVLGRHGVHKLNALGQKFNPDLHEALFEVPMPNKEAGEVIHVQQDGYLIKERLLRAAKVGVTK